MYRYYNMNSYSRKFRPAINYMLDINRQKYKKNSIIIKRRLSYTTPDGDPNDPKNILFMILIPLVIGVNNYFRKSK